MKLTQKMKKKISKKGVLLRTLIIILVIFLALHTKDSQRQLLNTTGFFLALVGSVWLHRHFAPFIILGIFAYLCASSQELWNASYAYLPVTKALWVAGNIFLPIGIFDFGYRIAFKYKITEHENL